MKTLLRAGALALALITSTCEPAYAQTDPFQYFADTVSAQCTRWTAVTPSDSTDLTEIPKAIWIGSIASGSTITMIGRNAPTGATGVAWSGVSAGQLLPVRPRRVLATGTTATSIVACY